MNQDIKKILELAVNAPSGHNSQPWKFLIKGQIVSIWNMPGKDNTLFNYKQRGSLVANGAMLENIVIAASASGYSANVNISPKKEEPNLIAEIIIEKGRSKYAYKDLRSYILKRTTNRKPYKIKDFTTAHEKKLNNLIINQNSQGANITFLKDRVKIAGAAKLLSMGDRILFENYSLHKSLFSIVNWTKREELEKREGLYIKTKELSVPERLVFKYLFSNRKFINKLAKKGLTARIAKKRERLYNHCSVIGIITAVSDTPKGFIESGRTLQRLWLTTTSLGLSFQPVSVGLLYLGQSTQQGGSEKLSLIHRKMVKDSYERLIRLFDVQDCVPTFSFRIGYSSSPTATSLKKKPDIEFVRG